LITQGFELTLPVEDFRFAFQANINDKSTEVFVVGFGQPILRSAANYDWTKQDLSVETTLQYLGSEPVVQKSSINGLTQGTFTMTKGKLLNIDSGYSIGKDVHLLVQGSGKEIFNGKIALDQSHFLTTNYHVDEAQLKAFTGELQEQLKKDMQAADTDVKDKFNRVQTFWTQKLEKIQKASPDFTQLTKEYHDEVVKLIDELKADPAINKLIDQATTLVADLAKTFESLATAISEQLKTIEEEFKKYYELTLSTFNENILPEIKKLYDVLQQLVTELYEQTVKLLSAVFERAAKALKTFEEDFNKISKAIKDATGNSYEAIAQFIKDIAQELKDLCTVLKEQIQTLPGVEFVKEKYAEILGDFSPLETVKVVLAELISSIAQIVPEQAKPFFDKISDYVQKVSSRHTSISNRFLTFSCL
jgi:ABC-type transporter Mla subunit MlaD